MATIMECLETDPFVLDTIYLCLTRSDLSQAVANIPSDEQPIREELEGYISRYGPLEDLAWSELYVELCAWLHDREYRRRDQKPTAGPLQHGSDGKPLFGLDYQRAEPLE